MSSQAISDYLAKQIFIERNIVTYRSLSREFGIHVNSAKNELAMYHDNAPYQSQSCVATYLLSGELSSRKRSYDDFEDVDMGFELTQSVDDGEQEDCDGDELPRTTIMVVNERDLESAIAPFFEPPSIHVYSLSPAPLHDAGLLCTPTDFVRQTDNAKGSKLAVTVGRVIAANIRTRVGAKKTTAAESLRPKPRVAPEAKPPVAKGVAQDKTEKSKTTADKPNEKPKATGKLGFFKAKPKESKDVKEEIKADDNKKQFFGAKKAANAPPSQSLSVTNPPQRSLKRKSTANALSDEDDDKATTSALPSAPSKPKEKLRVRKGVLLSDDEEPPQKDTRRSRLSSRAQSLVNSEAEREAHALMDIDDEDVVRVTRSEVIARRDEDEGEDEEEEKHEAEVDAVKSEDVEMAETSKLKTTRKKKEKKVIPVGKNGLKKRKVMKTRKEIKNGYMVTEDYTDWESVDEEDMEATVDPPKTKGKGRAKASKIAKKEPEEEEDNLAATSEETQLETAAPTKLTVKPPAKPSKRTAGSSKGGQKSLANFFGPPKAKKI